ncbi:hypothetical protein AMTR_s00012p00228430 [Amborella trichopoda]|uniref:Uncharacterized protein n=1 Tax=Amborella trichopoda TaxID=13333 RepID=W1PD89_AMBTC|nr:hypothetical protein AMTR_s00012p00228430 [Amborella trichopoda]
MIDYSLITYYSDPTGTFKASVLSTQLAQGLEDPSLARQLLQRKNNREEGQAQSGKERRIRLSQMAFPPSPFHNRFRREGFFTKLRMNNLLEKGYLNRMEMPSGRILGLGSRFNEGGY